MTTAAELLGDHLARAFSLLGGQPVQFDALGRVRAPFTPEPLPMAFKLEINTDNAAFEGDNLGQELAEILERIAGYLREGYTEGRDIRDSNGNHVGAWSISQ